MKDECDNVWFVYATKIQYRNYTPRTRRTVITEDEQAEIEAMRLQSEQTDLFTRELKEYQEAIEEQRDSYVMNKMRGFMAEYFAELKRENGFHCKLAEFGEDDT